MTRDTHVWHSGQGRPSLCEGGIELRSAGRRRAGEWWLENTSGREKCMGSEAWHVWTKKEVCIFLPNGVQRKIHVILWVVCTNGRSKCITSKRSVLSVSMLCSFCLSHFGKTNHLFSTHTWELRMILETQILTSLSAHLSRTELDNSCLVLPVTLDPTDPFSMLIDFIFRRTYLRLVSNHATSSKEISDFCKL